MKNILTRGLRYARSVSVIWLAVILFASFSHSALAFTTGENASLVIGQPNFATNTCSGGPVGTPTQSGLCFPGGVAFDSQGNLWVADRANQRVLKFEPPFSNGENASLVIGQSDFTTNTCVFKPPTQSGLCNPSQVAFDSLGNLWVADSVNTRVLEFSPPFSNGENASLVIGQPNFTTRSSTCTFNPPTQSGLCYTGGIAFDSPGNLWVADGPDRVLEFSPPFSNGENASLVIGQSSFTTGTCNGGFPYPPTQGDLCGPCCVAVDSQGNLWVADLENNRVLAFAKANFSIRAIQTMLTIHRGSSGASTITLTSVGGFSGTVTLNATITPITAKTPTASFSSTSLVLSSGSSVSSTLTISTVHSPKGDGNYTLTVTATSGSLTDTLMIGVTVTRT